MECGPRLSGNEAGQEPKKDYQNEHRQNARDDEAAFTLVAVSRGVIFIVNTCSPRPAKPDTGPNARASCANSQAG